MAVISILSYSCALKPICFVVIGMCSYNCVSLLHTLVFHSHAVDKLLATLL